MSGSRDKPLAYPDLRFLKCHKLTCAALGFSRVGSLAPLANLFRPVLSERFLFFF